MKAKLRGGLVTVEKAISRRELMIVLGDGDTWELVGRKTPVLVILPEGEATDDALASGGDADDILVELLPEFLKDQVSGGFNLGRLIRELPLEVLEKYRRSEVKDG